MVVASESKSERIYHVRYVDDKYEYNYTYRYIYVHAYIITYRHTDAS